MQKYGAFNKLKYIDAELDINAELRTNRRNFFRATFLKEESAIIKPLYAPQTPEVESALKEDARIRCIQRTLCYENRKLQRDLGIFGKVLAKYLT